MGEAKARRDAYAEGRPWRMDRKCPGCRGRRVAFTRSEPKLLSHVETDYGFCFDCQVLWEAYPSDWCEDVVGAEPCDNCAFRQGSPESQDREGWRDMLVKLKWGESFACHKGAPILVDKPTGTVSFDHAWMKAHGRMCAGFHRAMTRWPDWLERRYSVAHVMTTRDQDRMLADIPSIEEEA